MKKLILAAALTLSFTAFAEEPEGDVCDQLNLLAESIMNARQSGVEMRELVRIFREGEMPDFIIPIVIQAYEMPRFSVERNKKIAIQDFKNAIYLECIRSM